MVRVTRATAQVPVLPDGSDDRDSGDVRRYRSVPAALMRKPAWPSGPMRRVVAALALVGLVTAGCGDGHAVSSSAPTTSPTSTSSRRTSPVPGLDNSEACRYLASILTAELIRWSGSEKIVNAPVAGTRLGSQPNGGVPGILMDGCVWEVRGPVGGHVGVAVERFTDVDMGVLATMTADEAVTSTALAGGGRRWDVPASGDSPSGAVVVGDSRELVVVRIESHSDEPGRTFLIGILGGADPFFKAVGDAVAASRS